jgi:hypothetical protein
MLWQLKKITKSIYHVEFIYSVENVLLTCGWAVYMYKMSIIQVGSTACIATTSC